MHRTMTGMFLLAVVLLGCAGREAPAPPPRDPGSQVKPAVEVASGTGECRTDADCGKGHVCIRCGEASSCVAGCSTAADCPSGEICAQVQCIRCPCPALCKKP